jgi:hypothetical protein
MDPQEVPPKKPAQPATRARRLPPNKTVAEWAIEEIDKARSLRSDPQWLVDRYDVDKEVAKHVKLHELNHWARLYRIMKACERGDFTEYAELYRAVRAGVVTTPAKLAPETMEAWRRAHDIPVLAELVVEKIPTVNSLEEADQLESWLQERICAIDSVCDPGIKQKDLGVSNEQASEARTKLREIMGHPAPPPTRCSLLQTFRQKLAMIG